MPFTDNFTDTNGTLLAAHTPSGGTAWTFKLGTSADTTIQSNQCSTSATDPLATFWCDDQGDADCYTQFVTRNTNSFAIPACLRMTDSGTKPTYLGVRTRSNVVSIIRDNDGIFTTLGTGTTTVSSGDTIRIEADGDDIKAFINGTEETSIGTVTETLNNTVTQQGTAPKNNGALFDDFEAGVLVAGTTDGAGTIVGTATVVATGTGVLASEGAIIGTGTVVATGESDFAGAGAIVGTATILATGESTAASPGTVIGTVTVTAAGESTFSGIGAATGLSTVLGSSDTIINFVSGAGLIRGASTVSGVGHRDPRLFPWRTPYSGHIWRTPQI